MLRNWPLPPGSRLEQRREEELIAVWELVAQKAHSLVLKLEGNDGSNIELADGFYAEKPADSFDVLDDRAARAVVAIDDKHIGGYMAGMVSGPVLMFAGKNWKLASPKKWIPMNLAVDGYSVVGELKLNGKEYSVFKLPEGFAAKEKIVS